MRNEVYEKVEELCQKLDSYAEKDISVKNKVKTKLYITKIKKLIKMIDKAESKTREKAVNTKDMIYEADNKKDDEEEKYNPYSENFYYKDRLNKLDGDINKLIEELKSEDQIGYRNAYVITQIQKNIHIPKEKKGVWGKIKSIFK